MAEPFEADLRVIETLDRAMSEALISGSKSLRLVVQLPSGSVYVRTYKDWILSSGVHPALDDWK